MRSTIACAVLAVTTTVAAAQPGQLPPPQPYPPAPAPQTYPPPQSYPPAQPQPQAPYVPPPYVPPPYGYQPPPPVALTAEDAEILARGEIQTGPHILGVAAAYMVGFGSGQAIQGRWSDTGWIFTVGEVASIVAIVVSIDDWADSDPYGCDPYYDNCRDDDVPGLFIAGVIGLVAFRVWGMVDAVAGPISHNRRFRNVQQRVGGQPVYYGATPYLAPVSRGDGGVAGVSFRF